MMRAAEAQGAKLRLGRRHRHGARDGRRAVQGVEVDGEPSRAMPSSSPWARGRSWPPLAAAAGVFGLKGHSLVFETGANVPPEALFLEYQEPDGGLHAPEVFPRADGTTWVCAISSETPCRSIRRRSARPGRHRAPARHVPTPVAGARAAKVLASQACHRPVTQDGLPLIGAVPGLEGAFVATGHSVWGILNAPATGEAMAELIVDGAAGTVDLAPFDPARLPPLDPARLHTDDE